jgi:hypothetical protein
MSNTTTNHALRLACTTLFDSIEQVQDIATRWLWTYNHERPEHGARWHHGDAKIGTRRLAPLLLSVKVWGLPRHRR